MYTKIMAMAAISLCFALSQAQAQKYKISGTVQDSSKHPIDLAVVVLHSLPDSAIVKGTYADSAGAFLFDKLSDGTYFINVSAQGFSSWQGDMITVSSESEVKKLPVIMLAPLAKGLKEVEVTSHRSFIVQKQDRTVVNVDAMLTGAGSTALEILEKCPGVQVSQDGAVSLRGKQSVTIFINDKPSYLSGADLANYLKSLPSSTLDQIELMTNPPAQYDAAGNGGIINIKIKRKGVKGFNGGLNLSYTQGVLARSNNSLNLNYRNNKISAYFNAGYNLNNNFTDLDLNRTYLDRDNNPMSYFRQKNYIRRHGDGETVYAGADYSYSEKSILGVAINGMANASDNISDNTSRLLNNGNQLDSLIMSRNKDEHTFMNGGINLNYRTRFNKPGHTLTADADYIAYDNATEQVFNNDTYMPSGAAGTKDMLTGHLPHGIKIYSLKTDYALPLPAGWNFGSGLKTSYTETDNKAEYYLTRNSITAPDYDKSNQFFYKENINAAYVNINNEFGKFSVQAGLRIENTTSDGHQLGNLVKPDSAFVRKYTNAFPTVYLSYKFDTMGNNQIGFNYGRRIDRPYYEDLNPFIRPMDKFTFYVGNPFLLPSFNNTVNLSYIYKNTITTNLAYSKSANSVNETIEILNGMYYSRPGNIGSKTNITLSVDGDFNPAKWFNLHAYTELGNITSKSNFYNGTLNTTGTYWYIGINARLTLGKGWDGEITGNYRTKITDAQFVIQDIGSANIAIQKKLSSLANIKLGVKDVLYSHIVYGEIGSLSQATANWINKQDSRCATLTFSYRFGQAFSKITRHDASGAEAEKSRVKS